MRAILLAGGPGTRLRPLTFAIPKPLVPVGEQPILEILLRHLARHGCREAYLAVGYKAYLLQTYFGDGSSLGLRIHYLEEPAPMGTAGPLRRVRDTFGLDGTLLVSNADILTDADLRAMVAFHRAQEAAITVGTRLHRERLAFGQVRRDGTLVQEIVEKPELAFEVSAGLYVVEAPALDLVPTGTRFDMPDLINAVVRAGMRVVAHILDGYWIGIESLSELEQAREFVMRMEGGA